MADLPADDGLALETRKRRRIDNCCDGELNAFLRKLAQDNRERFQRVGNVFRTGPIPGYNCHGMTFGGRRTGITPDQLPLILSDDGYKEVAASDVLPGDVVIYVSQGDMEHSGIVLGLDDLGNPEVLSKWGFDAEVIHHITRCPYDGTQIKFFRIHP